MSRLIIIGAGGYGRNIADIAKQNNEFENILFLDDNSKESDVIGKCNDFKNFIDNKTHFYPAFGNNDLRLDYINKLKVCKANIATIISKYAYVSPTVKIGQGVIILPKAIINTGTILEDGVIINCGVIVDHNCIIQEGTHICLGTIIKAENKIPKLIKIDAGIVVQNRQYPLNKEN